MALSHPPNHKSTGGSVGAIKLLVRPLDLLPDAPASPLPLFTGCIPYWCRPHALANVYPDKFKKHLHGKRLDEEAIGKPSAVCLKKLLQGGFDNFKNSLTFRALHCSARTLLRFGGATTQVEPTLSVHPSLEPDQLGLRLDDHVRRRKQQVLEIETD